MRKGNDLNEVMKTKYLSIKVNLLWLQLKKEKYLKQQKL